MRVRQRSGGAVNAMKQSWMQIVLPIILGPAIAASTLGQGHDPLGPPYDHDMAEQIGEYVRRIFLDADDHLWFGTNGYGVCRFDGEELACFGPREGLAGHQVTGIIQDRQGDVWIATNGGVSRFDGAGFTNYAEQSGLNEPYAWTIVEQSDGTIWVGTLGGAYRFDGERFSRFDLPEAPHRDQTRGVSSRSRILDITETRDGTLWFATEGAGVFSYDGESLTNLSSADGLTSDFVNCVLEDRNGTIWIATHHGGVCRYDGATVTPVTAADGVRGIEAWSIFEDRHGHIWFTIEGHGVYRFDGESFTNLHWEVGLPRAMQSFGEDARGRLLVGGYGGLFRHNGVVFVNVKRSGPWE